MFVLGILFGMCSLAYAIFITRRLAIVDNSPEGRKLLSEIDTTLYLLTGKAKKVNENKALRQTAFCGIFAILVVSLLISFLLTNIYQGLPLLAAALVCTIALSSGIVDTMTEILPDSLTIALLPALIFFSSSIYGNGSISGWTGVLAGGTILATIYVLLSFTSPFKENIGFGDIKLLVAVALGAGIWFTVNMLFFATCASLCWFLLTKTCSSIKEQKPFGFFFSGSMMLTIVIFPLSLKMLEWLQKLE